MSRPVLPMVLGFSLHSYLPIFLTLLLGLNALPGSWRDFPSSAPLSADLFSSFSEWLPRCSGPRNGAHGPHQPFMLRNSMLRQGAGGFPPVTPWPCWVVPAPCGVAQVTWVLSASPSPGAQPPPLLQPSGWLRSLGIAFGPQVTLQPVLSPGANISQEVAR